MQQINLLKQIPVVEVKKVYLTPVRTIILIVGTWVGMFVLIGASFWMRHTLTNTVDQLQIDQQIAQNKLTELVKQYPEESKVAMEQKSKEIEKKIAAKQALLNILNQATGTNGYSKRLDALSKTITPDTWLTGIEFDDTEEFTGFAGKGFSSEGIFKFVDNLGRSTQFGQTKFEVFNLTGSETGQIINFVLSSTLGRKPEAAEATEPAKDTKKAAPDGKQ